MYKSSVNLYREALGANRERSISTRMDYGTSKWDFQLTLMAK